jgi:hypothetical protein
MTQKKDRDRVMAEITLSHLLRLANEHGCPVSREQALAFLNQRGRAYEMWKHMMQAGEDFIARSLSGADALPTFNVVFRIGQSGSDTVRKKALSHTLLVRARETAQTL